MMRLLSVLGHLPAAQLTGASRYADGSLGLWMAAFKANFFDDMRLCSPVCHPSGIAMQNLACSGLCDAVHEIPALHAVNACSADGASPLGYLDSLPNSKQFEIMRV